MTGFSTDYTLLLIALGLLYFPRQWLRWGKKRTLKSEKHSKNSNDFDPSKRREMGDPAVIFKDEFSKFRNYVDLLRGAAGSIVVVGSAYTESCFRIAADAPPEAGKVVLILKALIVIGALLVQLIRYERRLTLFAPIFFVGGLTFGLSGITTAALVFVLMWALNVALPNPTAFLLIYSAAIAVFGFMLESVGIVWVGVSAIVAFLPVLISLLVKRPLMLFNRRS